MPTEDQVIRHAEIGGRTVAWSSVGSGPALVVGGWWAGHLALDWEEPRFRRFIGLLAADHRVVRYDRPGTGLSDRAGPPPSGRDAEVGVLAGLVDRLGTDRVSLFAGSSGCPVVAAYAARNPDRVDRVVLYGGYARGADIATPEARATLVRVVESHWGLGSRVLADVFMPGADADERERFARFQRRSSSREVAAQALRSVYDLVADDVLPLLRAPVAVLHRRDDRAIPFALGQDLAARIPGATFVPLPGNEHLPWRGDAVGVASAVRAFLAGRNPLPGGVEGSSDRGPAQLSPREREVIRLVARGMTDAEIARELVLSVHTVHRHVANIRTRLGVASRAAAAAWAAEHGEA
ncbi:alpha/beta fold hydrolase [Nocardioides sp. MAHUQ-72]|uniref:alpha/beta fold hydrolase n=1 Tax=unclassified Nocardioides TaxID=2615069 RepID=UPI003613B5E9